MKQEELDKIISEIMDSDYMKNWLYFHYRDSADLEALRKLITGVFILGYNKSSEDTDAYIYNEIIKDVPHLKEIYLKSKEEDESTKN